jgi:hypothetical protein
MRGLILPSAAVAIATLMQPPPAAAPQAFAWQTATPESQGMSSRAVGALRTRVAAGFVQYHGDYAGVAQAALEQRHRGVTAMFMTGCGADANPDPRGTLELVQAHGTALADAVDRALPTAAAVGDGKRTGYGTVDLPFIAGGPRERWKAQLNRSGLRGSFQSSPSPARKSHAFAPS